jgi:hypothetical protein
VYAALGLLIGLVLFGLADALLYIAQKRWKGGRSVSLLMALASLALGAAGIFFFAGGTKELPVWGATLAWLAFFSFLALLFLLRRRLLSRRPRDDAASSPT